MKKRKQLRFDILTLFPNVLDAYHGVSIVKRAQEKGAAKIITHQIRDYATDKHHTTDDSPYGGGAGMVMKAEPILKCVAQVTKSGKVSPRRRKVLIMSAKGRTFNQKMAYELSEKYDQLIMISGRYEGIDERVKDSLKAEEVSIGPYVTTDGDVAAMVIVSAVTRLLPDVIKVDSLAEESHGDQLLEYPHYTKPEVITWKGKKYRVPAVLRGGNHKAIGAWRASKRKAQKP